MKLEKLHISGFKSFVDPVEVDFAGGINAIVGPNGCGKSNLSDAITWVLGEQSAKSMRGTKMEDVIFAGADTRKPVGMAEVSLSFLTDGDPAWAVEGRVTISRRVFRTGESRYRLNGKNARLKEIKDLLMDTGLGIRAYSVIEQGKIGMILSGKPTERRKLLEEAAGITRYKARRRVAEVKLQEASANLLRLDDILSEVQRSLRSLKRQASAARRYQAKEEQYRDVLRQVLLGRWVHIRDEMQSLEGRVAETITQEASLVAEVDRAEAELAQGRLELDRLASEVAARHKREAELAAKIEGRQEFVTGAKQRLTETRDRLERGTARDKERRDLAAELEASLSGLDERSRGLVEEREKAAREVADDRERIKAADRAVSQAQAQLESRRKDLLESSAAQNRLRTELQRQQVEIEKRSFRQRFLTDERKRLEGQLEDARKALATLDERIASHQEKLELATEERSQAHERLQEVLASESQLSDERREFDGRLVGLRERQRILEDLGRADDQRREQLLQELQEIGLGERPTLSSILQPPAAGRGRGWEAAIDAFLGELTDAIVLEAGDDGVAAARALSQRGVSATFLRPLPSSAEHPLLEDPAVHASLAEAVSLPENLHGSLPSAWLVDDAEDARRLAEAWPGHAFLSPEHVWARNGAIRAHSESAAPGLVARGSQLEEIAKAIPRLEKDRDARIEQLKTLVDERTGLAGRINQLDERIASDRREVAVGQARAQDSRKRTDRLEKELGTVVEESDELGTTLGDQSARREELSDQLEAAEKATTTSEQEVDGAREAVAAARGHRASLETEGAGRQGLLRLLEERLETHHQEAVRVRRQLERAAEEDRRWAEEREQLEGRVRELELGITTAREELQVALEGREEVAGQVLGAQQRLDARREGIRTREDSLTKSRAARDQVREELSEIRIALARQRQDAEHLGLTYHEQFGVGLPGAPRRFVPGVAAENAVQSELDLEDAEREEGADVEAAEADAAESNETSSEGAASEEGVEAEKAAEAEEIELPVLDRAELARLEAELAQLKTALERLGPVNVLAATEYDEEQDRESFLSEQRADIADSVESLKRTIREINIASTERFRATFEEVNKTFGETFQRLFRGGEAEMRLLDEDDVLDTGIEINARPPGKKTQNIMLLSGGEKALTAIALLFALFQTKPSPFCILDEVDAPLDDVNVIRYREMLETMAEDTQFLVITHNKLTMEIANTLYGVTMEEKGISRLVSVAMDDVQPESRATA